MLEIDEAGHNVEVLIGAAVVVIIVAVVFQEKDQKKQEKLKGLLNGLALQDPCPRRRQRSDPYLRSRRRPTASTALSFTSTATLLPTLDAPVCVYAANAACLPPCAACAACCHLA